MKSMTCLQLGGACDHVFTASRFEEIAEMSKAHGMEMFQKGDKEHIKAMTEMQQIMKSPEAMNRWFAERKAEFEALKED